MHFTNDRLIAYTHYEMEVSKKNFGDGFWEDVQKSAMSQDDQYIYLDILTAKDLNEKWGAMQRQGKKIYTPKFRRHIHKVKCCGRKATKSISQVLKYWLNLSEIDERLKKIRLPICLECSECQVCLKTKHCCGKLTDSLNPATKTCGCILENATKVRDKKCPLNKWPK